MEEQREYKIGDRIKVKDFWGAGENETWYGVIKDIINPQGEKDCKKDCYAIQFDKNGIGHYIFINPTTGKVNNGKVQLDESYDIPVKDSDKLIQSHDFLIDLCSNCHKADFRLRLEEALEYMERNIKFCRRVLDAVKEEE
jgi:hypothetical protein